MTESTWKKKRRETQDKIAKTVKECYAVFLKEGGDLAQCAGCPLGPECQSYNKTTRKARIEMTVHITDSKLLDRSVPISFLEDQIKLTTEMSGALKVEKIRVIDTWWL